MSARSKLVAALMALPGFELTGLDTWRLRRGGRGREDRDDEGTPAAERAIAQAEAKRARKRARRCREAAAVDARSADVLASQHDATSQA